MTQKTKSQDKLFINYGFQISYLILIATHYHNTYIHDKYNKNDCKRSINSYYDFNEINFI